MEWNKFESELKNKLKEITKNDLDEGSLQFEKIVASVLLDSFIKEGVIKRKKITGNKLKKIQDKYILIRG